MWFQKTEYIQPERRKKLKIYIGRGNNDDLWGQDLDPPRDIMAC